MNDASFSSTVGSFASVSPIHPSGAWEAEIEELKKPRGGDVERDGGRA